MEHMKVGIEEIVGNTGNYNVRDKFKRFDNRFIRPYLIRDLKVKVFIMSHMSKITSLLSLIHKTKGAEPKILETYSKLAMKDAVRLMGVVPTTQERIFARDLTEGRL